MERKLYILENLDCANCAAKIESKFNAHPHVQEAVITFSTKQLRLNAEEPDDLIPELTFYTRYGDYIGRLARYVALLCILYFMAYRIRRKNYLVK